MSTAAGFDFYLGTHQVKWLGTAGVPLFLSRRRLSRIQKLPAAIERWALDSGGFTELSTYGHWTISVREYVNEVRRYRDEVGRLEWAAIQDYMCEPFILNMTGLSIEDHHERTIQSYIDLMSADDTLPWVPVIQGYSVDDYLWHVDMYDSAGIDLRAFPFVGIGSVCRRQGTDEIADVIRRVSGYGVKLHGFGMKRGGIQKSVRHLRSADSMAWSYRARRMGHVWCGSRTHKHCGNCPKWALEWRMRLLDSVKMPGTRRVATVRI